MQKDLKNRIIKIVAAALREDCALNDITSDLTISKNELVNFEINAREEMVFCGKTIILEVFSQLISFSKFKNSKIDLTILLKDGDVANPSKSIARGYGDARLIFAAERVLLNLIQHLSGIATTTQKFVRALDNKKIKILDTRKTLPGLRSLEKYAVLVGGGFNHRMNLADMILIKDNHIAAAGGIENALSATQKNKKLKVEIECENLEQVSKVINYIKSQPNAPKPDIIMLDNMKPKEIDKCLRLIRNYKTKKILVEVSGGVNLNNIKNFCSFDINFISIGSLTHSVRAVDIGLDII